MNASDRFEALVDVEAQAAHISAVFTVHPEISGIWHVASSLQEAACSLSLEDLPVTVGDLLLPLLGEQQPEGDIQAANRAAALHTVLRNPFFEDHDELFDKCVGSGRFTSLELGEASYSMRQDDTSWRAARARFSSGLGKIMSRRGPILLRSYAAAALLRSCLPEPHPLAERLAFVLVDHALRRERAGGARHRIISPGEERSRPTPSWIMAPSISLTSGRFTTWAPTPGHALRNLPAWSSYLNREIGRLGTLVSWRERAQETFYSKTSRSRRSDLLSMIDRRPVLDTSIVSTTLGITQRGASKLLNEATETGVLTNLTQRRRYQVWIVPALRSLLDHATGPTVRSRRRGAFTENPLLEETEAAGRSRSPEEIDQRILADLDDAINNMDRVLSRHASGFSRGRKIIPEDASEGDDFL